MSSITHDITDDATREHADFGLASFTRLEKMLLFAVITECERCIESEGNDCMVSGRPVSCPFLDFRMEYNIIDLCEWKERAR